MQIPWVSTSSDQSPNAKFDTMTMATGGNKTLRKTMWQQLSFEEPESRPSLPPPFWLAPLPQAWPSLPPPFLLALLLACFHHLPDMLLPKRHERSLKQPMDSTTPGYFLNLMLRVKGTTTSQFQGQTNPKHATHRQWTTSNVVDRSVEVSCVPPQTSAPGHLHPWPGRCYGRGKLELTPPELTHRADPN